MTNTYSDEYLVSMDADDVDSDGKNKYRYSLTIEKKNHQSDTTLFVLMKNPSDGNTKQMDQTIRLLISHVFASYHKMILVNISPVVETHSKNLKNREEEIQRSAETNRQKIFDLISKSNGADLLIATGSVNPVLKEAYVDLMNQFADKKLFQHIYAFDQTVFYGHHPVGAGVANLENLMPVQQADDQWHLKAIEQ